MSTYLYLVCLDHDPPLRNDRESGQHLYDLPQIRADIANREFVVGEVVERNSDRGYFGNATAWFLSKHRKCRIGITDEYDQDHPVEMTP